METVDEEICTLVVTRDLDGQMGNINLLRIAKHNAGLNNLQ